jgi:hypothetical protein
MIFFGANYFGAVWTHYFSGETPPARNGEISVKVLPNPDTTINGECPSRNCAPSKSETATKPK